MSASRRSAESSFLPQPTRRTSAIQRRSQIRLRSSPRGRGAPALFRKRTPVAAATPDALVQLGGAPFFATLADEVTRSGRAVRTPNHEGSPWTWRFSAGLPAVPCTCLFKHRPSDAAPSSDSHGTLAARRVSRLLLRRTVPQLVGRCPITFKVSGVPFQRGAERSDAPSERHAPKGRDRAAGAC